jgi:poly-gamma-glutamate synthesis protein (capsule biosynthesis protein)
MYQKASQMAWPEILDDFKASGFTMLSAANNHYMDLGDAGLVQGLEESRRRGFAISGAGKSLDEATAVAIRTVKGVRVGLLSF